MVHNFNLHEGPCLPFIDERAKYKILVVEDEEGVRNLIKRGLNKSGYTNISFAENPIIALDKHPEKFDLYIIDCNMPLMGGKDYWDRIREVYPNARGIVATSHYHNWSLNEMVEKGIGHLFAKPFSLVDLVEKVDDILLYEI